MNVDCDIILAFTGLGLSTTRVNELWVLSPTGPDWAPASMLFHCWQEAGPRIFVLWETLNLKLQQRKGSLFGEVLLMLPWKLIPFPAFCLHRPVQSHCSLADFCKTPADTLRRSKTPKPGPEAFCEVPLVIDAASSLELLKCCNPILVSGAMSVPVSVSSKRKHL